MRSRRLLHRCASATLGLALVLSGFVLTGAHDGESPRAVLAGVAEKQSTPKHEVAPRLDSVVPPKASKPVVRSQQTAVPAAHSRPGASKLVAELPNTTTRDFGMVGVTWSEATRDTDVTVAIRTRSKGTWSSWESLDLDDLTEGGRPGTEPSWVGEADGVAVKVATASGAKPADIKVMTIDPGTSSTDPTAVNTGTATSSGSTSVTPAVYNTSEAVDGTADAEETADGSPTYTPKPTIITRAGWGAAKNTKCNTPLTGDSTHGAVVHHTAGTNDYTKAKSAAIVRSDQAYHMKGHGWCDIGYNFLVDKYGQIFEGRNGGVDRQVRAAHSGNGEVNTYGMGIAMAGNFEKTEPSAALKDSMVKLIGWRLGTTYKKAKGTYHVGETITAGSRTGAHTMNIIAGHRNVVSTACPGAKAYAWLSAKGGLRDRVENYIADYSSPIKTLAGKLGASTTGPVYIGEAPAENGRRTQFGKRNIFWSQSTGAHAVWGAVLTEYKRLGIDSLGFPTDDYALSADKKTGTQTFGNGYIRYTVATKKAVAHTGTPNPAPVKPTGLKAVPTSSGATLSWSAGKNAQTYNVCLTTNGTTATCFHTYDGLTKTSVVVTGLEPTGGKDYYFTVRSVNGNQESAWTAKTGFDLKAADAPVQPAKPTGLTAEPTSSGATLSWSTAANAKTYSVCLLSNGTTTTCTKQVDGLTTTSTVVSGLEPTGGTDWYFKVRSVNGTLTAWSDKVGFNLKPASASAKPAAKPASVSAEPAAAEPAAVSSASNNKLTVPKSRTIALAGHGFGHGVGMSQYGAQGAAIDGKKYGAILDYYYPGTTLASKTGNIRVLLTADTSAAVIVKAKAGLVYRNVATNKILKLPTKIGTATVSQWRIGPISSSKKRSALQYRTSGWKTYLKTTWTGDAQFEASTLTLLLPGGVSKAYRSRLRSAVPAKGSSDRNTVNVVSIENYVRGVVSAEMPSSWRAEALKSQSVAARTYGVRSIMASRYYDICDTTSCQVYGGAAKETTTTDAAIKGTAGKILTYGGKPAFTQFSSSSGGWSAAGSFAYLKAKADKYDDRPGNSVHSWTKSVSASTLEKKYTSIGTLKTLTITKRSGDGAWDGRVSSLKLTGSKGTKTITGNDARFALGLRSNWFRFS